MPNSSSNVNGTGASSETAFDQVFGADMNWHNTNATIEPYTAVNDFFLGLQHALKRADGLHQGGSSANFGSFNFNLGGAAAGFGGAGANSADHSWQIHNAEAMSPQEIA